MPPTAFFALSGGGDQGAFGAGLLNALDLFHSLMIASAAIPGAFPPVLIDVEAAGRGYQEMHVDGGAMAQVFVGWISGPWRPSTMPTVSGRSMSSATAGRDGLDFNLAYIPAQFNAPHKADFDTHFMRALFETGYDMAAKGYPWEKVPPDDATTDK